MSNPCKGCPFENVQPKVRPTIVDNPLIVCVGLAPGAVEEQLGRPFVGPAGEVLRRTLKGVGIPENRVSFVNVTRCRPPGDKFNATWRRAAKCCSAYFLQDIPKNESIPLIALGGDVAAVLLGKRSVKITQERGEWRRVGNRLILLTYHPSYVLRSGGIASNPGRQFVEDFFAIKKSLSRKPRNETVKIITDNNAAKNFLHKLSGWIRLWAFDIETCDGSGDARSGVALDPFHPDFQVLGIAFGLSEKMGVWLDLRNLDKDEIKPYLCKAFESEAPKTAFNGGFDEVGLIASGWIDRINNRKYDAMLSLVALDDGRRQSNKLSNAIVTVLGEQQYWDIDKTTMKDQPMETVAKGGVLDAISTLKLTKVLVKKIKKAKPTIVLRTKKGGGK